MHSIYAQYICAVYKQQLPAHIYLYVACHHTRAGIHKGRDDPLGFIYLPVEYLVQCLLRLLCILMQCWYADVACTYLCMCSA